MNGALKGVATAAVIAAAAGAGLWSGQTGLIRLPPNSAAVMSASASKATGPVIYYRDPDGKPFYSLTPKSTEAGKPYLAVHASEDVRLDEPSKAAAAPPANSGQGEKKILYYRNPMGLPDISPVPKKDSMGMDYIPVYEGEDDAGSVSISPEKIQRSGVRSEEVKKRTLGHTVRAPGIVKLDERRISVIALRFDGYLEKVADVTTGTHVKAGEPLMTIYAPELLSIGARLVVEEETGWGPIASGRRTAAESARTRAPVIGARRRLENMKIPKDVIDGIARTRNVPDTIVWRAPNDGIVLDRTAVEGMRAQAGEVLFRIADHSYVWVMADVPEAELGALKVGQPVTVRARAYPDREFRGKVAVVYPHLNKETRTAPVRIELPNPDLALLPDMYADVEITAGADREVVAVPNSAVIDSGTRQVVILDKGDGRFEPREVKLGQHGDGFREVTEGVKAGDKVVTAANFLIDAESNLRAALKGFAPGEPGAKDQEMKSGAEAGQ
ncbi:MAG: efflux RND transporter periplasmic adaptor subunit [Hyphomicrobium sp.]|uniref:efflux RND transporter periplasmic adaptor subunit n=1 Tax=Hyphomicrobium sp. TaxID=82 RepID=UPI00132AA0C4|nr:efflux RND transporter periplasmic adaptor subunit [Hyphomicrobium sp.]KAB2943613.1 MAG: efflux RND transporter periplasmic adaptor subunit [Hyphomicrobium sp.]MBZ0208927.1 efflux RND transporter periplasmic adaptor subunit [Hyphomicrobium sp.]